ncbi:MAG: beta strand repeat-containing protein [Flammeovirgaceae bacterium]
MKKFLFSILLAFITHVSWGQLLLNENLDYGSSAGDLTTVSGGNWANHSGSSSSPVSYATTSLSMTDYPATGVGGAATLTGSNSEDVNRAFTVQTAGKVYFSGLVNLATTGNDTYFFHLKDDGFGFTARIGAKDDGSGNVLFGISATSGSLTYGTTPFSTNTTYLLVASFDIDNGVADLYVLTAPQSTEPGTPEASSSNGGAGTEVHAVALRQSGSIPDVTVDGIRVGLSWADLMSAGSGDPTVSISVDDNEIVENGEVATITATLSEAVTADVTVNLAFSGSATDVTDYTTSASSILIPANSTTATMTITGVDDANEEPTEEIIVDIDNIVSTATVNEDGLQQVTINLLDNDFVASALYFTEIADPSDAASARFVELYNSGSTTIDFDTETWFLVRQANGGSVSTLQLAGSVAAGQTFVIANDSVDFNTAFGKDPDMDGGLISGNGDDGYFLYRDGNQTTGFLKDAYGVFGVDGTNEAWEYTDGHAERKAVATQSNNVWTASEWDITRPVVAANMNPCVYDPTQVNVTLEVSSLEFSENGGQVFVKANLSQVASNDVTVEIDFTGTADLDVDFSAAATEIVITAGELVDSVALTGINDGNTEGDELVIIDIVSVTNADELGTQQATVIIVDDETPPSPVFISEVADPQDDASARFVELYNGGVLAINFDILPTFLVRQTNGGSLENSIQLTGTIGVGETFVIAEDSAAFNAAYGFNPNMDHTSGNLVGFPISGNGDDGYFLYTNGTAATGTRVDAYGVLNQDGTGEAWEYTDGRAERVNSVTVANRNWIASEWNITRPAGVSGMTPGVHNQITVTLGTTAATIAEGGVSKVYATLSQMSATDVTVNLTFSGTATGGGTDYTASGTAIVIAAGNLADTVTITTVDDTDVEADETVIVEIDNVTNAEEVGDQQVTVTITNNDAPTTPLFISEVADPQDISSARFVELYNAGSTTIDFDTETWFLVRQSNGGSLNNFIQLSGSIAAGATFVIATDSADFNNAYGINPQLDHNSPNHTGFLIGGNGDDGYFLYKDGDATTGTLIDAHGVLDVDGSNEDWEYTDGRAERVETVMAANDTWTAAEWTITRPATANKMTPGVHNEITVCLGTTETSIEENGGIAKVFATLSKVSATDVTVNLAFSGTATGGGTDYMSTGMAIVIAAGELSDTVTITAVDDADIEGSESIIVDIDNVTNATEAVTQQVSITVVDDDTPPSPLFFSEIADPQDNSNARFVELYNAGTEAIDFDTETWFIVQQSNGGTTFSTLQLAGTINPGAVFVVANDSTDFNNAYGFFPNVDRTSSTSTNFPVTANGDDAYYLYKDGDHTSGTLIDIYGVPDQDGTNQPWEFTDGRAIRKGNVTIANRIWTADEWIITRTATVADMNPGMLDVDAIPPSVEIQNAPSIVNNTTAFTVTIAFSEIVTGFEMADITVGNGAASNFQTVNDSTFTADITPDGNGDITIDVAAAVAQDGAGNDNTAATQVSVTFDDVQPTVAILNAPSIVNSTTAFAVTFEFSEDVTDFEMADITVGNGAASNFQTVDANTYTADITPDGNGTITIDVAAAVAQDAAGNDNTAATQVSVMFDNTQPTVAIQGAPAETGLSAFAVTFEFSEDVTGFAMTDVTVGNGSISNFAATDGNTYTADITPDGNGDVTIDVAAAVAQDAAGNDNTAATQVTVTIDATAPTTTIELAAGADPLTMQTFGIVVSFSEVMTGFSMTDLTITNGTASNMQTSDNQTFTFNITTTTLGNNVSIVIAADVATDQFGNGNTGTSLSNITTDLEDDLAKKGVAIFAYESTITIQFADAKSADAKVAIFNLNGQLVTSFEHTDATERKVEMTNRGVFIIRVANQFGLTTKRVIVE